ncbi:unnamed protein product [Orchesella dallaii]|uniref:Uncharacterized protein n=1 Tax=Orchesella dallaii TaxID=48710 RepID=A0ABP1PXL1_9HEXA
MAPTARTHYPRQCKYQTSVQVGETRTSIKRSNTERRKNLIREFLQIFLQKSHMYAAYGTEPWIDSLLHFMNERPSYGLAPVDVKIWIGNENFFNTEVISILGRQARHGISRVEIRRECVGETCDVPPVQPHPDHRDIVPEEIQSTQRDVIPVQIQSTQQDIIPGDIQSTQPDVISWEIQSTQLDIIPGEFLSNEPEHGVETEIVPEAIPLSADPHEIEPEVEPTREPMVVVHYDFVAPLPPPLRGSYSDTVVILRELQDSWTRTCEILDDLKLRGHPGIYMDQFYHIEQLMKNLAKELFDKQVNSFTSQ